MRNEERDAMFSEVSRCISAGDFTRALETLEEMHRDFHAEAAPHVRIHWLSGCAYWRLGNYVEALKDFLVIPFAVIASLVQKHFGLARKNL
jgi:hypothetical protein